jgi:hypothetical protein
MRPALAVSARAESMSAVMVDLMCPVIIVIARLLASTTCKANHPDNQTIVAGWSARRRPGLQIAAPGSASTNLAGLGASPVAAPAVQKGAMMERAATARSAMTWVGAAEGDERADGPKAEVAAVHVVDQCLVV